MSRNSKSGAKAERDALRQEMLISGCSHDLIAQEMERRWGFRPREAHRHADGCSQDQIAARFTQIAERLGADRGYFSPMIGTRIGEYERWPHGGRRPSAYVLTVLATVYGTTVDRLLDYDDYRSLPDQDRTVVAALLTGAPPATPAASAVPGPTTSPGGIPAVATVLPAVRPPAALPAGLAAAERPDLPGAAKPGIVPTAATALMPPGQLPTRADVPAKSGSAARRRRRDELLDRSTGTVLVEEEAIVAAAGQSAEFGEWAEATNVGPTTLEQFEQDVRRIAHAYLRGAPLPLLLGTLRVRNRAFTLLEGRQHPKQSRDLYVVAGRICGLLSWMSGDVGRSAEAETQARTGWLCAELADHDGLRAWIRATQSKQAYWDGRFIDSARLAEAGLSLSATDSARVLLASLAARAWARLGNADDAHAALARASHERDALSQPDEVGGLYGFSEAQQSYLAGTTHLWLREPAEALRSADRAVWLYEIGAPDQRFYGAETLALIDAATAQLHAGELDGAKERLDPVLALPPEQRLETFTQRLSEMRDALRRTRYAGSTAAIDIQRRIEDFRAGALGQYLSR